MKRTSCLLVAVALSVAACSSSGSDSTQATTTEGVSGTAAVADSSVTSASGSTAPESTDTGSTAPESPDTGTLDWAPCDEQVQGAAPKECATLEVPLDYSAPDGDQIEIAVARFATAGDDRIGSLVFNPGGPGGSGIDFLDQAAAIMPPEVQTAFDLVSFDPRGVGASTAVECDAEVDDNVALLAAGDDATWNALLAESADTITTCTPETIALAPFVGTNDAARDLDRLREALGDEKLDYVGYSYGTRLGATYAELFPDKIRAMVLDGAVAPTTDFHELDVGQAAGFDRALENFAAACDADTDCLLHDVGPTLDVLAGLRTEIAEVGSFPTDDPDRVVTPGEFEVGVFAALYSRETWPFLAQALFLAESEQDATLLQVLGDQYLGRQPDGTYDNSGVANSFINCADDAERPPPDEVRRLADEAAAQSQYFDETLRATTGCLDIPPSADPLVIGPAEGAPPIVVIGNTGDPATPYDWSVAMADFLDSGVLFSVEAEGHTAFGSIDCVAEPIVSYLVDLVVPEAGATCSDNADADFFVPIGETEVGLVVSLFDCLRDNGLDVPEVDTADILADPTGESLGEFLDPTDPAVNTAIGACIDIVTELQGGG